MYEHVALQNEIEKFATGDFPCVMGEDVLVEIGEKQFLL